MTSYNRILIAVDLTSDSAHVIARAREIGAHYAAELNLVHVIEPIPVVYMLDSIGTDYSALYAEATRQSRDTLLQLGGAEGIPVARLHHVIGSPAREIRNVARNIQADLIVVGGHGKHGLELLLGSVSSGVTHGAACDLLIVRIPEKTPA